ncbi:MAG: glycerol-3-phosphate 1-O-acyltransferase [Verrucomicrobia bacterium]|nr:glycerol-3-phosphate 1-O-acyltransferase [Verrucomicrobiota bacterium]NBS49004.1 glycerol-3-phosphate 1-O-acyltransferase [Verrucomicrobiota bacterium]NBT23036.1 glycerol-3-phosphate 1-O-acyltransferase [bacterium]NBY66958.1 glycerol-3-phosphate 1-O-acyltransferase [Verrucomicrobiota bacterium]
MSLKNRGHQQDHVVVILPGHGILRLAKGVQMGTRQLRGRDFRHDPEEYPKVRFSPNGKNPDWFSLPFSFPWANSQGVQSPVPYLLLAFFLGSLPFGHWLALFFNVDLRKQGSGNTGATNVSRVLGKKWGYLVFALDFAKGWLPVFFSGHLGNLSDPWVVASGGCAVLGHVFTPWLGFRGGKGVATSAGILVGLSPWVALGVGILWWIIFQLSRTVSVASLGAATAFPILVAWLSPQRAALQWASLGLAGLVWLRHRDNIQRIFQGKEKRF